MVDPGRDGLEAGLFMLPVPASSVSSCSPGVKTVVMKLMALSCPATYWEKGEMEGKKEMLVRFSLKEEKKEDTGLVVLY